MDEESLRAGEWLAYLMLTWHEFAQWFGDRSVFFASEKHSAFTWDDVGSHVIGIRVGDRAMRDRTRPFDAAATAALEAELRDVGAVRPEQTDEAARAVEGRWWAGGAAQTSARVRPARRRHSPLAGPRPALRAEAGPEAFAVPGHRAELVESVRIDPASAAGERMRHYLPGKPQWFDVEQDLPILLRVMAAQMREEFGPEVGEPWPGSAPGYEGGPGGSVLPSP